MILKTRVENMINRNVIRIAVATAFLAGLSQASLGASSGGIGASCFVQENNARYCRSSAAEAGIRFNSSPGICGSTVRTASSRAFFNAIAEMGSVQRDLCPKSNTPVSYF
jgi:hypothetical protein